MGRAYKEATGILVGVKVPLLARAVLVVALVVPAAQAETASPSFPARAEPPVAAHAFAMGKMLASEGELQGAVAAYDHALALSAKGPDSVYILLEKAQVLMRAAEGRRDRAAQKADLLLAVESVAAAQRLAADNLDVLRGVAEVQLAVLAAGDASAAAKAAAAFEAVIARDPKDIQAAVTLARIDLAAEQPDRAADVLRQLIDKVPQQRMPYSLLVEALLRAKRTGEAETALAEILAFDPGALEARLTLADLQFRRGDAQAAKATLLAAPAEIQGDPRLKQAVTRVLERAPD